MKTTHHKTAQFPAMKRLAMYICFIIALCFFNLVAIEAQLSVNQTNPINPQLLVNQGGGGYAQVSVAEDTRQQPSDDINEDVENAKALYKAACKLSISTCLRTMLAAAGL